MQCNTMQCFPSMQCISTTKEVVAVFKLYMVTVDVMQCSTNFSFSCEERKDKDHLVYNIDSHLDFDDPNSFNRLFHTMKKWLPKNFRSYATSWCKVLGLKLCIFPRVSYLWFVDNLASGPTTVADSADN